MVSNSQTVLYPAESSLKKSKYLWKVTVMVIQRIKVRKCWKRKNNMKRNPDHHQLSSNNQPCHLKLGTAVIVTST
jgi:hypothetical protein